MASKFFSVFFIFFFAISLCFGQNYKFYGILSLYGHPNQIISYELVFQESNGHIKGFSITDIRGPNETKTQLEGTYDEKTKELSVREQDIIYTKSQVSKNLFCFVHFKSKIKLSGNKLHIKGDFTGLYQNGQTCAHGQIGLLGVKTVKKLLAHVNRKIQKSKKLDAGQKQKYNAVHLYDSLQTQQLTSHQNLSIFNNSNEVTFEIWDGSVQDGDRIQLSENGKILLADYTVTKAKKFIRVKLTGTKNIFTLKALNQGSQGLNTVMVNVIGNHTVKFLSNLKTGESTSVTLIKK